MHAVIAMEPSGRMVCFVGTEADCVRWRRVHFSEAWRAHGRAAHGPDWERPYLSEIRPKEALERELSESLGGAVTLPPSQPLPRWDVYGFGLDRPDTPPSVQPFGPDYPNTTGHPPELLQAMVGALPGAVTGTLAEDWHGYPIGTLAVLSGHARNVTALCVQAQGER